MDEHMWSLSPDSTIHDPRFEWLNEYEIQVIPDVMLLFVWDTRFTLLVEALWVEFELDAWSKCTRWPYCSLVNP